MADEVKIYDLIKIVRATNIDIAKANIDKIQEGEPVLAMQEAKLLFKIGNKLFSTSLTEEV